MFRFFKKILLISAIFFLITKVLFVTVIFIYPKIISADNLEISAQELIQMTNNYRESLGLNALKVNPRLTQAAVNKARDLLAKQYFNHTSPDGKKFSDWIKEVNYKYFYVGENLAIDFDNNQNLFGAWLDSPTHQDNIIKSQYQEIGLAVLKGKLNNQPTTVVVQLFGTRILGEAENFADKINPVNPLTNHFLFKKTDWQKIISLENLEKLNRLSSYFLMAAVGFFLITYSPQKKVNQINIKQPIINRYQAKIFRE